MWWRAGRRMKTGSVFPFSLCAAFMVSECLPFCSACADFTATRILLFIYHLTSNTNTRTNKREEKEVQAFESANEKQIENN